MKKIKIYKKSAGNYLIDIYDLDNAIQIETNDSQLIDDIKEYIEQGHESNLVWFESFKEIETWINNGLRFNLHRD